MIALGGVSLDGEPDVVSARQGARRISQILGFEVQDQTRIATAVSEVARNAVQYAGGGRVDFLVADLPGPSLLVRVADRGPGIRDLPAVLGGRSKSEGGLGLGLAGVRRVMDHFDVESPAGGGALVSFARRLPAEAIGRIAPAVDEVRAILRPSSPANAFDELKLQNRELMRTLAELAQEKAKADVLNGQLEAANRDMERQGRELSELNRELVETNRGVVALYAEIEDRAFSLQRVSDLKSRFLSNMSHEFRTPLNSILSLGRFLLEPDDGLLSPEKTRQVRYILAAAEGLSTLVNDLLDLAKVESGKVVVRPERFEIGDVLAALRGMFRPLLDPGSRVALVFDDPGDIPTLSTDESKLGQVLRNLVSNALKFTEAGEVRVGAARGPGDTVVLSVSDTGIGIGAEDLGRIFEEFGQVDGPIQKLVKGTGLGLPLSKRLAELLGGTLDVRSEAGAGSTFRLTIPRVYGDSQRGAEPDGGGAAPGEVDASRAPVLVVEDDPATLYLYESFLKGSGFRVVPARTIAEARRVLREIRPAAVILDILLEAESGWTFLEEMKSRRTTRDIPIIVLTVVAGEERALALGASHFSMKPASRGWLLETLNALPIREQSGTILIIDDDEINSYILRTLLIEETTYDVVEARRGADGLELADRVGPLAIFLDLVMPEMSGFEVLAHLKAAPKTASIPVVIRSSSVLSDEDREILRSSTAAILAKDGLPREDALAQIRVVLDHLGLATAAPSGGA